MKAIQEQILKLVHEDYLREIQLFDDDKILKKMSLETFRELTNYLLKVFKKENKDE